MTSSIQISYTNPVHKFIFTFDMNLPGKYFRMRANLLTDPIKHTQNLPYFHLPLMCIGNYLSFSMKGPPYYPHLHVWYFVDICISVFFLFHFNFQSVCLFISTLPLLSSYNWSLGIFPLNAFLWRRGSCQAASLVSE